MVHITEAITPRWVGLKLFKLEEDVLFGWRVEGGGSLLESKIIYQQHVSCQLDQFENLKKKMPLDATRVLKRSRKRERSSFFLIFPPEFFAGLPSSGTVPDPPQSVETIYGFLPPLNLRRLFAAAIFSRCLSFSPFSSRNRFSSSFKKQTTKSHHLISLTHQSED